MISDETIWQPARTRPEHALAPDDEFCGYMNCRHHMDSHSYDAADGGKDVPCTECVDGWCRR